MVGPEWTLTEKDYFEFMLSLLKESLETHHVYLYLQKMTCDQDFENIGYISVQSPGLKRRDKKVQCPTCGMTLAASNLSAHMRTHTGFKPYKCPICQQPFARKANMDRHKNVHQGQTS